MPRASKQKRANPIDKPPPTFDRPRASDTLVTTPPPLERRLAERAGCRIRGLTVDFADASGAWIRCVVPSRNISRTGLAVLTNQYIFPKTPCRVHLLGESGEVQAVAASVVRCRYLPGTGRLHEVGLRFDKPLELALAERSAAECRILICDTNPAVHQVVPRLLSQIRTRITSVHSGAEAVNAITAEGFDIVLLDGDQPGQAGGLTVGDLRSRGFSRPIIAITTSSDPKTLRRCLEAGFTQMASPPLTRDSLTALIRSMQCEPLISGRAQDAASAARIAGFVGGLPQQLSQIEISLAKGDMAALEPVIRGMKNDAAELGFEVLGAAAEEFEAALRESCPKHVLRDGLSQLSKLGHAAQSGPTDAT